MSHYKSKVHTSKILILALSFSLSSVLVTLPVAANSPCANTIIDRAVTTELQTYTTQGTKDEIIKNKNKSGNLKDILEVVSCTESFYKVRYNGKIVAVRKVDVIPSSEFKTTVCDKPKATTGVHGGAPGETCSRNQ